MKLAEQRPVACSARGLTVERAVLRVSDQRVADALVDGRADRQRNGAKSRLDAVDVLEAPFARAVEERFQTVHTHVRLLPQLFQLGHVRLQMECGPDVLKRQRVQAASCR